MTKYLNLNMEKLEKLLQSGKWESANTETMTITLTIYNDINCTFRSQDDAFLRDNFQNFLCESIREIDALWRSYSNNRFGISVQKDIYKSVGGRVDGEPQGYHEKEITDVWKDFSSKVGWNSLDNRTISFDNLEAAPNGYLPFWNDKMIVHFGYLGLFCRMENCENSVL